MRQIDQERREQILQAFDLVQKQLRSQSSPGFRMETVGPIARSMGQGRNHSFNFVTVAEIPEGMSASEWKSCVQEQVEFFRAEGRPFVWKLRSHLAPPALAQSLEEAGYASKARETLMALDLVSAEARPLLAGDCAPAGVDVREVGVEAIPGMMELQRAVWGEGAFDVEALGKTMAAQKQENPERLRIFAAFDGERLVANSWLRLPVSTIFGSLWGGSTLAEYRGRGIYRAMTAHRARAAQARGFQILTVEAGDMSCPILSKLGFFPLSELTEYKFKPTA